MKKPELKHKYIRDKRSPKPSSPKASELMSRIKGKNTKPELIIRKLLCSHGLKGYRLHWKVEGRPDIAYVSKKVAIFINGCYWHRCPKCHPHTPKSNSEFWKNKFAKNIERDKRKIKALESNGWKVLILWECDIKSDPTLQIENIKRILFDI